MEAILQKIAQLNTERKAAVGEQEARIKALQTQVDVQASSYDTEIATLKKLLLQSLTERGAEATKVVTDHYTYSFWYKDDVDMERLKAMAVEIPQIQQCLITKSQARLTLK